MADQRTMHPSRFQGIGAAAGVSIGPAVVIDRPEVVVPDLPEPAEAFKTAAAVVAADLGRLATETAERGRDEAASVLQAQALMAEDPMLASSVEAKLADSAGLNAAITESATEIREMLQGLDDPYLAARAADVDEVVERISCHLAGIAPRNLLDRAEPSIYLARSLTAAETAQMDPEMVLGFVTETGGPTSHVVIIARSMGVPAVVGTGDAVTVGVGDGDLVALDGATGEVVIGPDDEVVTDFGGRIERHRATVEAAAAFRGHEVTFGGSAVSVAANVANETDLERAIEQRADGIGLLRTEFLFLDRPAPPSEDEQYDFYARAVAAFDAPVVIRTIDIGGDKPADYLSIAGEENPFLGVRGARLYRHHPAVFESQIKAILRAAVHGDLWMMIPMISTVEEIIELRAWVERVAAEMAESSDGPPTRMPRFGVMVEVPAIAIVADAAARHVDFFSIGSNDLTQYTLAADRMNEDLGHLQDAAHPSVLSLCNQVAASAARAAISVSVCGLSAADPDCAAAYAAMGMDKLSVSASAVNLIKATVAGLEPGPGRDVVDGAMASANADEARVTIARWRAGA